MIIIQLPNDYLDKMKDLLKDVYKDFIDSYTDNQVFGLRINTLKVSLDDFLNMTPFQLAKIPWIENGFYYQKDERPGKHPYHDAGLYYIQEPSAMAVVEMMQPKPGEKVLDLAAAPGGKTTQIANYMKQQGLLVANEIHPTRARILSQNVERLGIKNTVVTNESPSRLAKRFPAFFDRILVDAPCSGEGMFRKNPETCHEWSLKNVEQCAIRQANILNDASKMLKVGGQLVYSTCTFSPEENEQIINQFIKAHPNFIIEKVQAYEEFSSGHSGWVKEPVDHLDRTIRIWPHLVQGEGHFIAVLRKIDGEESPPLKTVQVLKNKQRLNDYFSFAQDTLQTIPQENFVLFGEELYVVPPDMIHLSHLKVLRPGWHLGTNKKNRFEPSHSLALSLGKNDVHNVWDLNSDSPEIISYMNGQTFQASGENGWYLMTVDGYSIGWGKLVHQMMKNHYPKGLRWQGV